VGSQRFFVRASSGLMAEQGWRFSAKQRGSFDSVVVARLFNSQSLFCWETARERCEPAEIERKSTSACGVCGGLECGV
jgi:hypothetical protein